MTIQNIIDKDLQTIENDLGQQTFTWDEQDYVCVPGGNQESAMLSVGGFGGDITNMLYVRKSVFADSVYPEKEDIITVDGIQYELDRITDDATKTFFVLYLKAPAP